jgi:hypothetical protein
MINMSLSLQYLNQQPSGPPAHLVFATDSLETQNAAGDDGPEQGTSQYWGINTGGHFLKQNNVCSLSLSLSLSLRLKSNMPHSTV